ncbi:hypothetical protein [Bdellovibrio sp. HCB288]|uniref:hypothetical protein n=1 Tax=Bdellovibrio sp. HCB288 TaxID=3394355 RepID=UPI0039B3A06F
MKTLMSSVVIVLLAGSVAFAEEVKTPAVTATATASPTEKALETVTGKDKKARKKKVHMCGECGKPEVECECPGHK